MAVRSQPLESADESLSLRPQDVVLSLVAAAAAAVLASDGRAIDGWRHSAVILLCVAVMPWVFRAAQHRWPGEFTRFLATIVPPTLGIIFIYASLDPLVDLLNPHLADARLAQLDLRLFGFYPGIWFEQHLPTAAVDALFFCYTSYYLWPLSVGLLVFADGRARERELDRYILGFVLLMLGSYVGYILMPAIGPRFFLVDQFGGPLHSGEAGQRLDLMFRSAPYFRDCFPSGHTALTLYCLYEARDLTPRFFRVILVPAVGLILATVACRFHYAVDVLCAPLLTVAAIVAADALYQRMPAIELARIRLAMALGRSGR